MSSKTIVLALVLAILLAAVAMVVVMFPKSPAGGPVVATGDRIIDLDAAHITAIDVVSLGASGRTDAIVQGQSPGSWDLIPGGMAKGTRWALDPSHVRALFRTIAETRAVAEPAPGAAIEPGGSTLVFHYADDSTQTIRLSGRTLAGQGLAGITAKPEAPGKAPVERLTLIPDTLHAIFAGPGPRAWRERMLFAGIGASANQIRLVNKAGSLALGKGAGRWLVNEPIVAVADPQAIAKLLTTLEGLWAVRFYDEPMPDSATGLDNPAARIIAQGPDGPPRELAIGGPADSSGRNVFATADGGRSLVAIDATVLAKLTLDATRFLGPAAAHTPPSEVGMIGLSTLTAKPTREQAWRRTADGWVELRSDGSQTLLPKSESPVIEGMLSFLDKGVPTWMRLERPPGYAALATLKLSNLNYDPVEDLEVGTFEGGGLVLCSGHVYRAYSLTPPLLATFLGDLLPKPRAGDAANPPDINK